jgi:hypothetical protein
LMNSAAQRSAVGDGRVFKEMFGLLARSLCPR